MFYMDDEIVNSCRVCGSANQDGEFESLYLGSGDGLSAAGQMYESMLGIRIEAATRRRYPEYLCNSCDLQMMLFKKLKNKAHKTLEALRLKFRNAAQTLDEFHEQFLEEFKSTQQSVTPQNEGWPNDETPSAISQETISLEAPASPETHAEVANLKVAELAEAIQIGTCEGLRESPHYATEVYNILIEGSSDGEADATVQETKLEDLFNEDESLADASSLYLDVDYLDDLNDENTSEKDSAATHNELSGRSFQCRACSLGFDHRAKYIAHRKEVHANKYPCTECHKQLQTANALRVHKRLHEGPPEYKCELCGRTFYQKVHYKYHMDNHNNVRKFKCAHCDKAFLSKTDLNIHTRTHTGTRPYACDICGKDYLLLQHLKMHMYSHRGKSFNCELCTQKFTSPSTLRTHIRTIHVVEPQFKCEFCIKRFRRKHHLVAHYKVHQKPTIVGDDFMSIKRNEAREEVEEEEENVDDFLETVEASQIDGISVIDDDQIIFSENVDNNDDAILI